MRQHWTELDGEEFYRLRVAMLDCTDGALRAAAFAVELTRIR